ncbi:hypothetical protein Tco_1540956 [Tanacetum coccineum]
MEEERGGGVEGIEPGDGIEGGSGREGDREESSVRGAGGWVEGVSGSERRGEEDETADGDECRQWDERGSVVGGWRREGRTGRGGGGTPGIKRAGREDGDGGGGGVLLEVVAALEEEGGGGDRRHPEGKRGGSAGESVESMSSSSGEREE